MAQPIVPHLPRTGPKWRWSLPMLLVGGVASLLASLRYGGKAGFGVLFAVVLAERVFSELRAKRTGAN